MKIDDKRKVIEVRSGITDIDLAPRNAQGLVEFSGDFFLLKPVDMRKGNGRLLMDVANRGRKVALGMFNSTPRVPDPSTPEDFGNGFLYQICYLCHFKHISPLSFKMG